jgi:enoyl-CoA hydratase/carnithine racemase
MGPEPVKHLFFSAGRIGAARAQQAGLVGEVFPRAELDEAVADLATRVAQGAPLTITAAKRAIDTAAGLPGAKPMAELQSLADACFQSNDYREGRSAFLEKRKAVFTGR